MNALAYLDKALDGLAVEHGLGGDIAVFSPDRRFRYVLTRDLGHAWQRVLVVVGLNPSTADASSNDPTIRRLIGFARSWNCGMLVMLNAYAYRATDPSDMWAVEREHEAGYIVGERNDAVIAGMLKHVATIVPTGVAVAAWGTHVKPARVEQLQCLAAVAGVQWQCLGHNAAGSPKHPLYVPRTAPLVPWPRPPVPELCFTTHIPEIPRVHPSNFQTVTPTEPRHRHHDGVASDFIDWLGLAADDIRRDEEERALARCSCSVDAEAHKDGCPVAELARDRRMRDASR